MSRTDRVYVGTLAGIAAGILIVGYSLRPVQPTTDEPILAPSQTELSRLAQITQRRSIDDMTDYFATVADDVESSVIALPSLERTGLIWESGIVLTARTERIFPLATTVSTSTGDLGVASVVSGPQIPIATVRVSEIEDFVSPGRRPANTVEAGSWVVAVWRRDRTVRFVPAYSLDAAVTECDNRMVEVLRSNIPWTRDMVGGGVFDLDSRLIAVILPCNNDFAAVTAQSIDTMLRHGRSVEGHILGRYGIRFESLTEDEQQYFERVGGVIIREVWTGHLADQAGLLPGDLLLAINAEPIGTTEQLSPLANPEVFASLDVAVYRGEEILTFFLPTAQSITNRESSEASTVSWKPSPGGYLVDDIFGDRIAGQFGIRSGDRLIRINGEFPETLDQVFEAFESEDGSPIQVEIDNSGRRWSVLLK